MIGNNDRITRAVIDVEFLRCRPGILSKAFPHVGAKERICAMTDFRICIEQSKSRVGYCDSSSSCAAVCELELAILVVCTSWASLHVDLIIIVLAGSLEQATELHRVASQDPRQTIRYGDNRTGGT